MVTADMNKPKECFRKAEHLCLPTEFRRVYDRRCSARNDWLTIYACPNDLGFTRVGLSVSRKVGIAVTRNRIKRRLREAFRLTRQQLPLGLDLVFVPRVAKEISLESLKESLVQMIMNLAIKLGVGNVLP
jgi:ribonuclease P protein component